MADPTDRNSAAFEPPPVRTDQRYKHITIGLRCRMGHRWESIRANDWNTLGFNFYHDQELGQPDLAFKQGAEVFEGEIIWRSTCTDDQVILTTLLNELLYRHSSELSQGELHARFVKLIREPGMVAEKLAILRSLGVPVDDKTLADRVIQRRAEQPMFRYGVQVDSSAWNAIVQHALNVSSVVLSLEKMTSAFSSRH